MKSTYVRVKGIIKKGDTYLLLKRWVDDRIPDPFVWEFIDAEVPHGEAPDETMLNAISELLSISGKIEKVEYTWSQLLGGHRLHLFHPGGGGSQHRFVGGLRQLRVGEEERLPEVY